MSALLAIIRRDLRLAARLRAEWLSPVVFYVMVISLFPLGLSPEPALLERIAPAVVWVAALLATLMSLDRLFRSDFEDGSLEQMLLSPTPTFILILGKIIAHWLSTGLVLIICAPMMASMLGLSGHAIAVLMLSLLLGTPVLNLIGAVGTALTVGLKRGGVLLAIIVLPLYVPVLVFGTHAVASASEQLPVGPQLTLLAAMLVLSATLTPWATAASLKLSIQE